MRGHEAGVAPPKTGHVFSWFEVGGIAVMRAPTPTPASCHDGGSSNGYRTSVPSRCRFPATHPSAVDTRTQAGRKAFDRVLMEETDASLQQIRSAVVRLVAKKKVRFKGKTAARRYWARG